MEMLDSDWLSGYDHVLRRIFLKAGDPVNKASSHEIHGSVELIALSSGSVHYSGICFTHELKWPGHCVVDSPFILFAVM